MDSRDDVERLIFFQAAREKAAADYIRSPEDADNLMRWGGALLELAQFQQGQDQVAMVEESEAKLKEALAINPRKHEALWCLGNAHTSHAFLLPDSGRANEYIKKATECFKKALEEDPGNDIYYKSLEMAARAPSVYVELQKEMFSQQLGLGSQQTSTKGNKKKKQNNDFKYDILGWGILVLGVIAWLGMAKVAPPRPM